MAQRIDNRGVADIVVQRPSGFIKVASIDHIDLATKIAYVKIKDSAIGPPQIVPAQLPISYFSSGGGFIGGKPRGGTPVLVAQAEGGANYYIVSFLAQDPSAKNTITPTQIIIPSLSDDQIVIQANTDESITLDDNGITIGDYADSFVFDTNRAVVVNTFDNVYSLTQASRSIEGSIKRDRNPATIFSKALRAADASYDDVLSVVGMDPIAKTSNSNTGSSVRNPARIEKHEVVFEYEQFAYVRSNDVELQGYNPNAPSNVSSTLPYFINRREGRSDALSLSLVSPNYLMESTKGTVVDIFGNIVDINRSVIPIGTNSSLSVANVKSTVSKDTFNNVYEQIKRFERKSLAYHFEINARKETNGSGVPDVNNTNNYARLRSRFHFDIDKEGQFKLNVPASSEMGNVPLLTRYENYSTVNLDPATKDPNALLFNSDYTDILTESFANATPISLVDDLGGSSAPIDRITTASIGLGTTYHNIAQTCITFQTGTEYVPPEYVPITSLANGLIPPIPYIVTNTIITAGPNANAGGRSGQMNFDGSIEVNIGANTVDRQSLWLDTQGGIVAAIGRDLQNISLAGKLDGQVFLEIGGSTVPPEQPGPNGKTRFANSPLGANTGLIAGALDIRVYDGLGSLTVLRIDVNGITISTPGGIVCSANGPIQLHTNSDMYLEAENMYIQGREVVKDQNKGQI
jgi:hypothetical protein